MSLRKRILTIVKGGQPDQVPWFGDLEYWAAGRIGREEVSHNFVRSQAYIDWHRDLGVIINFLMIEIILKTEN